jgi:2-oxoglutarate dehydrogenase E1 component
MSASEQHNGSPPLQEANFDPQSLPFVEALYEDYVRNPGALSAEWRRYFDQFDRDSRFRPAAESLFPRRSLFHASPAGAFSPTSGSPIDDAALQERVDRLVHAYRVRGHILSHVDPLSRPLPPTPELTPAFYGLTTSDLDRPAAIVTAKGTEVRTVRRILQHLRNTYCRSIGAQFMHIDELTVRKWLQQRMESTENRVVLKRDVQLRILGRLTDAVVFEEFLQKKYRGAKSFSLEGAESLIPLLDLLIEKAAHEGTQEIVLGMAHRGRLNVLANILGKKPRAIFREFEDVDANLNSGRGDVKYHLGYSSDWKTASGGVVHLSLCFNPSHLEFINPVVLGRTRAKQDRFEDHDRRRGMSLLVHGDAAFAGEGVVQETLNLSGLAAYHVGGAIHVIVNNQLGFTTLPQDGRSSPYATDVAKMLQIPIFHVNGEDPEAVAQVVQLALDFRSEFQRDVVIDMYCYRRRGHNEGDEPAFTQPLMCRTIEERDPVRENYLESMLLLGEITVDEAVQIAEDRRALLERELALARDPESAPANETLGGVWTGYEGGPEALDHDVETGVPRDALSALLESQMQLPADFHPHPKIERWIQARREMAAGQRSLDWAAAESLALAALAVDGVRIRLTGQDSIRGTFSHRHAAFFDVLDGKPYFPLQHLTGDQAPVEIGNSPLSENGPLGFEYGYSLDCPEGLVMWEAQFGDFVNAAQVIIDQFIVSAEDKWRRLSGLVLLLPHGYEGQGPEHSSARLERFLTLAAEDNIQVVVPTTPAQYFHLLRRQVMRRWRKPLVVMTPKSLLRHPQAVSALDDLTRGTFSRVLPDPNNPDPKRTRRVLLCAGKIYYDLVQRREELKRTDVAIVRLEQLYPLPTEILRKRLTPCAKDTPVVWVQDEPANMGAWPFLRFHWQSRLFDQFPLFGVTRAESASPATGSGSAHKLEQQRLLEQAFDVR